METIITRLTPIFVTTSSGPTNQADACLHRTEYTWRCCSRVVAEVRKELRILESHQRGKEGLWGMGVEDGDLFVGSWRDAGGNFRVYRNRENIVNPE